MQQSHKQTTFFKVFVTSILVFMLSILPKLHANEEYFRAMQDEMTRSLNQLHFENQQRPYFIEYTFEIKRKSNTTAVLGKIIRSRKDSAWAELNVAVRVGSYKFDQKNFFDIGLGFFGGEDDEERYNNRSMPLDADYATLRRELWLATDAAYKQAAEIYAKKEAVLKGQTRKDTLWDLAPAQKTEFVDTIAVPAFDLKQAESIVIESSNIFRNYPAIQKSEANLYSESTKVFYLNSEGTKYIKSNLVSGVEIGAYTQAADGAPLANFYVALGWQPSDLPSKDSIVKATEEMADVLSQLAKAPVLEESYTGPILFAAQPACEAFAQVFVPCLAAQREPFSSSMAKVTFGGDNTKAFQTKIGGRVLPEFFNVEDIPTMKDFAGKKLLGSYKHDDEGVPAQNLLLVSKGYLKTLLTDRNPVRKITTSNGHSRGGNPLASNVKIDADANYKVSEKELKDELIKLCKQRDIPFGLFVKRAHNPNIFGTQLIQLSDYNLEWGKTGRLDVVEVYKVYQDGREELTRGGNVVGLAPSAFRDVIKVGNTPLVYNYLGMAIWNPTGGKFYGQQPIGIIGLAMLFEDGEYRLSEENLPKVPVLANPVGLK